MMTSIAVLAKISLISPYSAIYDQAFRLRGEVHEKEFSCGSSNAMIILLKYSAEVSFQTPISFLVHSPFDSSIHTQAAHGERGEEI